MNRPAAAYDFVVRGATVLTSADSFVGDIAVADGRVAALGAVEAGTAEIVDARGLVAVPGGVDAHTHFDMPFAGGTTADDFETGTRAALFGGTTTIIDFATQRRGASLLSALEAWHAKADGRCLADYAFHMAITDFSARASAEVERLAREGVTSLKLYLAYPGTLMSEDDAVLRALRRSNEVGALVSLHCENGRAIAELVRRALREGRRGCANHPLTRPPELEAEAVRRAAALARAARAPVYLVHLSAAESLETVRRCRQGGAFVLAETCPQYLYLSAREYERPGLAAAPFVVCPPLRSREDAQALWAGLAAGEFQAVASDHCSFPARTRPGRPGKDRGRRDFSRVPGGAPGVETRLPLLWEAVQRGDISTGRFVELAACGPAKAFGLYPRKGHLNPGADADIVLIDPRHRAAITARALHHAVDYTPFEGLTVHGAVRDVWLRGKRMLSQGRLLGRPGDGRYISRSRRQFCL
ncbi:MAG: dihydropyrimidinase [Elusimicrobia bacterium]|nr:dihydropyrimidinase [Elusimicrobiota bacterium]